MNGGARSLRKQMDQKGIIIAPGCYDALSSKIIEEVGFKTIYLTGHGISVSLIGKTDAGLTTMSEVVVRARDIINSVSIPVIVDADTGYGNPINVQRTVTQLEQAGAAGIQLEDQVWPKKCGHFPGKKVIPKGEMIQKIRAAVEARKDSDLVIIARTDAYYTSGIDEAIDRVNAYIENGADIGFLDGLESMDNLRRQVSEVKGPVLANMVEGGKTPFLTPSELEKMGYKIVIFPLSLMYSATFSMLECAKSLLKSETTNGIRNKMMVFEEFNDFMGLPEILNLEKKYGISS